MLYQRSTIWYFLRAGRIDGVLAGVANDAYLGFICREGVLEGEVCVVGFFEDDRTAVAHGDGGSANADFGAGDKGVAVEVEVVIRRREAGVYFAAPDRRRSGRK